MGMAPIEEKEREANDRSGMIDQAKRQTAVIVAEEMFFGGKRIGTAEPIPPTIKSRGSNNIRRRTIKASPRMAMLMCFQSKQQRTRRNLFGKRFVKKKHNSRCHEKKRKGAYKDGLSLFRLEKSGNGAEKTQHSNRKEKRKNRMLSTLSTWKNVPDMAPDGQTKTDGNHRLWCGADHIVKLDRQMKHLKGGQTEERVARFYPIIVYVPTYGGLQ